MLLIIYTLSICKSLTNSAAFGHEYLLCDFSSVLGSVHSAVSYGILWPNKLPLWKLSLSSWQYNTGAALLLPATGTQGITIPEHSIDLARYKQPYVKLALQTCKLNDTCFDTSSVFLLLDIRFYNVFIRPQNIYNNS